MKDKKVKTISITAYPGYFTRNPSKQYNEELTVSKNKISYKRTNINSGKITRIWEYTTSSYRFSDIFNKISAEVEKILPTEDKTVLDGPTFLMNILYSDNTSINHLFFLNFEYNEIDYLALLIKQLIPIGEQYPKVLDFDNFLHW